MAGYSDTEIASAVTPFVRSDIKVTKDPLGPIDLDAKFEETLQFLSSTLVFDPNAIFYLVFLVTNKLNVDVQTAIAYVDDILEALTEVSKTTKAVTRTSLLGDAAASLLALETIVVQNGVISGNVFERYKTAVDAFRDVSLAPNIRGNGNIVRPPQKAKSDARASLAALEVLYPQILARVAQLRAMLSEFLALDLPSRIMQSSVQTTRRDLLDLQSTFEDPTLSIDAKIAETRDAYLRITSGKSVLNNLVTISDPREPRVASTATLKGRAVNPLGEGVVVSASVTGTRSAPWDIETGVNDVLNVAEDGQANTPYTLVPAGFAAVQSYVPDTYALVGDVAAVLVGTNAGPFVIPAAPDNNFMVVVDGAVYSGALTVGGAVPIATIVTDVQAIPGLTTVVNVSNDGSGRLKLEHVSTGTHTIVIGTADPLYTSVNTALGFTVGQNDTGTEANNRIQIDSLPPLIVLTTGAARTAANIVSDINAWVSLNYPGNYLASVETIGADDYVLIEKTQVGKQKITMTVPASGVDRGRVLRAYTTLGFSEGQNDTTTSMTAAEVAKSINDADKIDATVSLTEFEEGTNGSVTGPNTFTVPAGSIANAGLHVDDQLLIRTGSNADYYRIVSIALGIVQTITVDAVRPFPVTGTTNESWRVFREVLVLTSKEDSVDTELVLAAGSANTTLGFVAGTYLGTTTGFRATEGGKDVSFTAEDVVVGDIVRVGLQDRTVTEITADGKQLEVTPPFSTDTSLQIDFQILSIDAIEYAELETNLTSWDAERAKSLFAQNIQELVRVLNPILNKDGSTTADSVNTATNRTNKLRDLLIYEDDPIGLSYCLVEYDVRTVPRVDAGLRMLTERGFDRAYDTLMLGDVDAFFNFDKDDAGTGSFLLKAMRQIAQKDVPVSRRDEDADDTVPDPSSYYEPDANYTFSDQDSDDNLLLIGESAVIDSDDVAGQDISVSRSRYR